MYTCWRGEGGKGGGQGFGSSPGLMAVKWGEPGERSNQGWRQAGNHWLPPSFKNSKMLVFDYGRQYIRLSVKMNAHYT